MSIKQERETARFKSDLELAKAEKTKYEDYISKLSNQIVCLNDQILEYKKQNAILTTKLKHLEGCEAQHKFKRPSSIHVSVLSAPSSNLGANLAMEDEEGEVFNNTYLADLKSGRMSDLMCRDVSPEELLRRNSQLPPHLKSAYAAQYAHGLAEEDLKDGIQNLDDSMSALLSTTIGGTRKKISGATSYKRPGPPTPSKNGGRLSFGGSSEPGREILKETFDCNQAVTSSSKTPTRFKMFASRFSLGNVKDEYHSNYNNLHKAIYMKNVRHACKNNAGTVCTSTPRKSKEHIYQQRVLDLVLAASPSPSPLKSSDADPTTTVCVVSSTNDTKTELNIPMSITKLLQQQDTPKNRQKRPFERSRRSTLLKRNFTRQFEQCVIATGLAAQIDDSPLDDPERLTSETTSSGGEKMFSLRKSLRYRSKRKRSTRPSFYLKCNIFSKNRTATRDMIKRNARKHRIEIFNKHRMLKTNKDRMYTKEGESNGTHDIQNNNYANFNHNQMGRTVVIEKNRIHATVNFEGLDDEDYDDDIVEYDSNDYEQSDDLLDSIDFNEQQTQTVKHFEEVLTKTESHAPFNIKKFEYESTIQEQQQKEQNIQNVSSPTSRTFYGSSTIYNRKIPNISTTFVRKSSIYIKNRNGDDDIILLTDQTITLMDLIHMWRKMNSSVRLTLGFAILASFFTLIFVLGNMFFNP